MGDNCKLYDCAVFQPSTANVFLEFDPIAPYTAKKYVYVKNISEVAQTLTVDSPLSRYVSVDYSVPRGKVLPKKSIQLEIKCAFDLETRPYYDRIIVKCSKGCGCFIKITLSPKNESSLKIPSEINMGIVPLGETTTVSLILPPVEKRMPFMIICSVCCPELTINPVKGTLGDRPVTIQISYKPLAYVTASFPLHLYLPMLTALPYFILVTADTKPGLIGELIAQAVSKPEKSELSPVRKFPKSKLPILQSNSVTSNEKDSAWTHHKINVFLMKRDKIDPSPLELLGPLGRPISIEEDVKKVKQEEFLREVERIKNEEACAMIHKSDFILHPPPVDRSLWDFLWQEHEKEKYGFSHHTQVDENSPGINQSRRPIKPVTKDPDPVFTERQANMWPIRYRSLKRFIQASRTIVIQNRLMKRLKVLKCIEDNGPCEFENEDLRNDAESIKSPQ